MATKKAENKASGAFAVVMTGGKQYRVRVGDTVKIEKIKGDFKAGDKVVFDKVLLTDDGSATKIGAPHVSGAKVEAKIEEIGRDAKVVVVHYKAKSKYFKKAGHRQPFFKVGITAIK
jgi:large subunit ribosomal protein L21